MRPYAVAKWCAALLLATLSVGAIAAQNPASPAPAPSGLLNIGLLRFTDIRQDLKITDAQLKQMEALFEKYRKDSLADAPKGKPGEPPPPPTQEQIKRFEARDRAFEASVLKILNATQVARLKQLSLQSAGTAALLHDEVATTLKLTESQKKKLVTIFETAMKKMGEAQQKVLEAYAKATDGGKKELSKTDQANLEKMANQVNEQVEKLRVQANTDMYAVLTVNQKKQWDAMLGKKLGT